MPIREQFESALAKIEKNGSGATGDLHSLMSQQPHEFRSLALGWLTNGGGDAGARALLSLLHQRGFLVEMLVNARAIPLRQTLWAAELAGKVVEDLDVGVAQVLTAGNANEAKRALQILYEIPVSSRALPALSAALGNDDPRVRAGLARLIGGVCRDPESLRPLLNDADPRVRANAIEALWGVDGPSVRQTLQQALQDSASRVAANAALGLFKLGDPVGVQGLCELLSSSNRGHQISAIWAMKQTGDPRFLQALENLPPAATSAVRQRAAEAATSIRSGASPNNGKGS